MDDVASGEGDCVTDEIAVIHEPEGFIIIDWEYARLGETEGWLKLDGFHRDSRNRLVYRYLQVTP